MVKKKSEKVEISTGGKKHTVYKKTAKKGEGKAGHIMVTHSPKDKSKWDTINLTEKAKAKTVKEGVEATKKWHKDNPHSKYKDDKMAKGKKKQAAIAVSMKKAGKIPKGYHKMPDGTVMKDSAHKMKKGGSTPAWTRAEGKNKTGGLNAKGVASYRRENPSSKLQMAVTTKPSKLDPDSKDAKRRKSFCARSAGQMAKFPKAAKDPNSRLRLARKKWNC